MHWSFVWCLLIPIYFRWEDLISNTVLLASYEFFTCSQDPKDEIKDEIHKKDGGAKKRKQEDSPLHQHTLFKVLMDMHWSFVWCLLIPIYFRWEDLISNTVLLASYEFSLVRRTERMSMRRIGVQKKGSKRTVHFTNILSLRCWNMHWSAETCATQFWLWIFVWSLMDEFRIAVTCHLLVFDENTCYLTQFLLLLMNVHFFAGPKRW